jgi:hypothetical protein
MLKKKGESSMSGKTRGEFVKEAGLSAVGLAVAGSFGALPAAAQETKHGHLIKKIIYRRDSWRAMGPGNADLIWWPKGPDLENKNVNFSFGFYSRIGPIFTKNVEKPFGFYMVRLDKGGASDVNPA